MGLPSFAAVDETVTDLELLLNKNQEAP